MAFLTVLIAAFIGGTLGQALTLWVVGTMAARAEKQKAEILQQMFEAQVEANIKERERMHRYAKMEG